MRVPYGECPECGVINDKGPQSISVLKDRHHGETIWIVGSGASLNFVDRRFFDDKVTVLVNETYREFGQPLHTFAFAHHCETAQEGIDRGFQVVASEYNRCDRADGLNDLRGSWFMYRHPQQPDGPKMDMTPMEQDDSTSLVVGSNTVTSAMDFAGRILGASTIILCGVDGGTIDGRLNYDGYNRPPCTETKSRDLRCMVCESCLDERQWEEQQTVGGTGRPHLRVQLQLIGIVAQSLRVRGIGIHSLNPFVDLGLERHAFAR